MGSEYTTPYEYPIVCKVGFDDLQGEKLHRTFAVKKQSAGNQSTKTLQENTHTFYNYASGIPAACNSTLECQNIRMLF